MTNNQYPTLDSGGQKLGFKSTTTVVPLGQRYVGRSIRGVRNLGSNPAVSTFFFIFSNSESPGLSFRPRLSIFFFFFRTLLPSLSPPGGLYFMPPFFRFVFFFLSGKYTCRYVCTKPCRQPSHNSSRGYYVPALLVLNSISRNVRLQAELITKHLKPQ